MKILSFAWDTVTSISRRDYETLKLILSKDLIYPILSFDSRGYVLKIPIPCITDEGFYRLHGLYFDQDERSIPSIWKLFKASLYHAAFHAAYSNFKIYSDWARGKDLKTAIFSVSLVEDLQATMRGIKSWPGLKGDITYANYVSSQRLDYSRIEDESLRIACNILLGVWGIGVRAKNANYNELKASISSIRSMIEKSIAAKKEDREKMLIHAADIIYSEVKKGGLLREIPFFPYTEEHGRCEIFDSRLIANSIEINMVYPDFMVKQNEFDKVSIQEATEFFQYMRDSEERRKKIRQRYDDIIATTKLESLEFPAEDYAEFLRVRSSLAGPIKNIRDQLRLVKNVLDETYGHESGQVDTQAAMQVIASGNIRTDVFMRDEPIQKNEAWAILIDASKSTSSFSNEFKGIATCLAEVSNELIPVSDQWAIFSFNNSFQIIKDFSEEYSIESKARIGGIEQRNKTLLPDAMIVAYKALLSKPVDNRIMIVASDGYPAGYNGIDEKLVECVKKISSSGTLLMGIGIDSNAIKDYFNVNCVIGEPYQMMKSFVKSYLELSSSFN